MGRWLLVSWAAALLAGEAFLRRRGQASPRAPLDLPVAAFLACLSLGTVLSADPAQSFLGVYTNYVNGLAAGLQLAVLYWAASRLDAPALRRLCAWAAAGAALAGLYGLLQYLGVELFAGVPLRPGEQAAGSLGNPAFLGAFLMACLPLGLCVAEKEKGGRRAAAALACLLMGLGLAVSAARSAWLGAAAACALYAALRAPRAVPLKRRAAWGGAALAAAGLFLAVVPRSPVLSRHLTIWDSSSSARLEVYKGALAVFSEHPWLGLGPDTFKDSFRRHKSEAFVRASPGTAVPYQAHGDLFQVLATLGLLGLGLYLWGAAALAKTAAEALARAKDRPLAAALAASLAGLFLQRNLNAASLAGTALGAVLAGGAAALWREGRDKAAPAPAAAWLAGGGALAAVLLALMVSRLAWADHARLMAEAARRFPGASVTYFREAIRLNPENPRYRSHYAAALEGFAGAEPRPELRRAYIDEAIAVTAEGVRRHPGDPEQRHQHAVALFWAAGLNLRDSLDEARAELERALELDPTDPELLANRARFARGP